MRHVCRLALLLALSTLVLPGCYFSRRAVDVDRTPVVDTGMGAAVILPGETAPSLPSGTAAPGPAQTSRSGPNGSDTRTHGASQPATGKLSQIGGTAIDEDRHESGQEDPLIFKWLTAPLGLIAAPFAWAAQEAAEEPEPGPPVPQRVAPRAAPPPLPEDFETQNIRRMEEELARRSPAPELNATADPRRLHQERAPRGTAQVGDAPGRRLSIADELAALQRAPQRPAHPKRAADRPIEGRAGEPATVVVHDPKLVADGIVDRNEDGRVDQWIYREDGDIVRKLLDEDFDGRPETTLHYDPHTHRVIRVEEDTDRDGNIDTWTGYREGKIQRRRVDGDGDSQVDTWTYYEAGAIARHEQDTTGDGFRDRIGHYAAGRLVRDQHDRDGDGRPDLTTHYDAQERVVRREEDFDGDGSIDVITHYENGRLARKELLSDPTTATP